MKRILGIDPGFGKMGFGCIEVDRGVCRAKDFGVITTKPKEALPNRLKQLAEDLRELVRIGKPTSIAVEQGIPVVEVFPNQVKKALTGDGHAGKPAMQKMVKILLGLSRIPKPDDAADALAIAITAVTIR